MLYEVITKGNSVPNSTIRSTGLSIKDSRFITVKNNVIKNSEVIFASSQDNHAGYSLFEDNNLENGSIQIIEACREIIIRKNKIVSPPDRITSYNVCYTKLLRGKSPNSFSLHSPRHSQSRSIHCVEHTFFHHSISRHQLLRYL